MVGRMSGGGAGRTWKKFVDGNGWFSFLLRNLVFHLDFVCKDTNLKNSTERVFPLPFFYKVLPSCRIWIPTVFLLPVLYRRKSLCSLLLNRLTTSSPRRGITAILSRFLPTHFIFASHKRMWKRSHGLSRNIIPVKNARGAGFL